MPNLAFDLAPPTIGQFFKTHIEAAVATCQRPTIFIMASG
jgi:hypothetical protein